MKTPARVHRRVALAGVASLGAAALAAPWIASTAKTSARITLDPSARFQTMTGWEATAELALGLNDPDVDGLDAARLDFITEKVGINRIRLEIRSGAEDRSGIIGRVLSGEIDYETWKPFQTRTVNDNADPFTADPTGFDFGELDWHVEHTVKPMQERLAARGERLFVNVCYVSFVQGPHLHTDPEEYAEFVVETYRHLEDRWGFLPDTWEAILEPDNTAVWRGPVIGRAIAAAARRLRQAGYSPAFIVPSVTDMRNAVPYMEEIAAVPDAIAVVSEFAYHRYRGAKDPATLEGIAAFASQLGIRTSMLELWLGKATYEILHQDLTVGNVSAWQGRALRGHVTARKMADGTPVFALQPEVRYNAAYFRAVRMGATRIGAASDAGAVAPLAFENRGGGHAVILKAEGAAHVTVEGLAPGRYALSVVTDPDNTPPDRDITVGSSPATIEIPGPGVAALHALT